MAEFFPLSDADLSALTQSANLAAHADGNSGEQFLRLRLAPGTTVLLPLEQLTEVLTLATHQIMPMPHMPAWTMGVYNWRGEILWIVDLGHLCGLPPWYHYPASSSSCSAVILQVNEHSSSAAAKGKPLGLVVHRVEDIEWCVVDEIQRASADAIPSGPLENSTLDPFLQGYWRTPQQQLAVLDGRAILNTIGHRHHPDFRLAAI